MKRTFVAVAATTLFLSLLPLFIRIAVSAPDGGTGQRGGKGSSEGQTSCPSPSDATQPAPSGTVPPVQSVAPQPEASGSVGGEAPGPRVLGTPPAELQKEI